MLHLDDQPETIHLYVVREEASLPQLFPIVLSLLALLVLAAFCTLVSYEQPVTRITLRVPAILLPLKTFSAQVAITPTGSKTYPATTAHGVLTITNGSIISQTIPGRFTIGDVTTDESVFVPAGSANGYGLATVPAHAISSGKSGNIPAYSIDQVIGSSIYIRNLTAFTGGRDAYSIKFITAKDRLTSLAKAHYLLTQESIGLHSPCREYVSGRSNLQVKWVCQFVTYKIPTFLSVTKVRLTGKDLLIECWFVERPRHIWVK